MALPIQLRNIPPGAYRHLADYYADLAAKLRARADDYERGTGTFQQLHQEIGTARDLASMVQAHIVNGMSRTDAYQAVKAISGETIETVRWAWQQKYDGADKRKRERRRARVFQLQREDHTPRQIALITGLSEATVRELLRP